MRGRVLLPCLLALALAACGGGGGPVSTPTTASGSGQSPSPVVDQSLVGQFRACHRTRQGSLVLVFLFEDRDVARAQAGGTEFVVTSLDPTTWSDSGAPVTVDPGENRHVRQVEVPPGQLAPSEITLQIALQDAAGQVLAQNQVTLPVPASSCTNA